MHVLEWREKDRIRAIDPEECRDRRIMKSEKFFGPTQKNAKHLFCCCPFRLPPLCFTNFAAICAAHL